MAAFCCNKQQRAVTIYRQQLQKQRLCCLNSITAVQRESGGNGIAHSWQQQGDSNLLGVDL